MSSKKKTPNHNFEFQNKIFDFKEIQSPNVIFKDYGNIFNEDDEDLSDENTEKEVKFSGFSNRHTPKTEKVI